MHVPYLDLKRQYIKIKNEIDSAIQNTIDGCVFVAGEKVRKFEENFAKYCGSEYAVGVSSGTSALYVALKALGIGKNDIVVTVPFTFIATLEPITLTGARPVFIDIEKESYNLSAVRLVEFIEKFFEWNSIDKILVNKENNLKMRAIMPVHLYGQMSDMDEIMKIANKYNLFVLEDAAQAHGATYKNRKAGSIGTIGTFSFYPSKNLGAFGQGGAVVTDDANLANKVKMFINHGQSEKYHSIFEGWNFKMDGFQAAILDVKLKHLDDWNKARQNHANTYRKLLKDTEGVILPNKMPDCEHIYHLFVIRIKNRDSLHEYLKTAGVGSSIAYPIPLHLQNACKYLGHKTGDFPNAEECAKEVLALPIFPELTEQEIVYICEKIKEWLKLNHSN